MRILKHESENRKRSKCQLWMRQNGIFQSIYRTQTESNDWCLIAELNWASIEKYRKILIGFESVRSNTNQNNWTQLNTKRNRTQSKALKHLLNSMEIYWIFLFDWCWIEFGNQTSIVRLTSIEFDWFVNRKVWLTSPGKKLHGACNNVTPLNPYIIRQLNQWHVAYIEFCKGLKFKLQFLIF